MNIKISTQKNILLLVKSLTLIFVLCSIFVFSQKAKAAPYLTHYDWDCFKYDITLDKSIYYPGETITVTASAWNNGCEYDSAWVNMTQTVHNVGIDAISSGGNVGTVTFTAPTTVGTHYIKANTYRYFERYVYSDTYAPQLCVPDNWQCGESCIGEGWYRVCVPSGCGFKGQSCTGGQRISHVVIGQCCGQGGDTTRSIPFQVAIPTATITPSSGTNPATPIKYNSTVNITWSAANVITAKININNSPIPWVEPGYETVTTTTNHPEEGITLGPWCFGYCIPAIYIKTKDAYTTTETTQVFNSQLAGTKISDKLKAGDNIFTITGYGPDGAVAITKVAHVYVATSTIIINIGATDPITGQSVTSVTSGSSTNITWNATNANACAITRDDVAGTWKSGTSGTNISSGFLTKLPTTTFTATCTNTAGDSNDKPLVIGVVVPPPPPVPLTGPGLDSGTVDAILGGCIPNPSGTIFVNKSVAWNIQLSKPGLIQNTIQTRWSGNDVSPTGLLPGSSFSKIYTTVGPKTIYATTTAKVLLTGQTYTATCFATTTVRAGTSTSQEI